jgi:hypothetical protein
MFSDGCSAGDHIHYIRSNCVTVVAFMEVIFNETAMGLQLLNLVSIGIQDKV